MNERIRQLADEAKMSTYLLAYGLEFNTSIEKFAELIVKECVAQIESKRSSGENTDQWTITRDLCYHNMMKELKEHFGVEDV